MASLDDDATGSRRERLDISISSMQNYQDVLFDRLMRQLDSLTGVIVLGRASSRVPTLSFTVDGVPAEKVAAHLADRRIATVASTRGSSRLLDSLGVSDEGGAVSIGLAPYTTSFEVDQLVRELRNL